MKKTLFALTTIYLSAFAIPTDFQVVNVTCLSDHDLQEISQGKHPDLAVEFLAHTQLPISFYLKGNVIQLAENDEKWGAIEIKQTFYGRCTGEELLLSTNLTDWKPFLEFFTGTTSASLSIQNGVSSIIIGTEANKRS